MKKISTLLFTLLLAALATGSSQADGDEVAGVFRITPAELGNCLAVELTPEAGQALESLELYESGDIAHVAIYRAADVESIDLDNPLAVLGNLGAATDQWTQHLLTDALSGGTPLYVVFRPSDGAVSGLAYQDDGVALPIFASPGDGDWYRVAASLSPAVRPTYSETVFGSDGGGSLNRAIEPPVETTQVYETALLGASPNPTNPSTTIRFSLKDRQNVGIRIYNVRGELVWQAADRVYSTGAHEVTWHGKDVHGRAVASGIYYAQMRTSAKTATTRIAVVR